MMNHRIKWLIVGVLIVSLCAILLAKDRFQPEVQTVKIAVSGLHCQGCIEPVEKGLKELPGVRTAKLDLKSGIATVQFDDSRSPVSQLVNKVATIRHAMGANMKYGGRLILPLKVQSQKGSLESARKAVAGLSGVQKAELKGQLLFVTFKPGADKLTLAQITSTLSRAGASVTG